MNDRKKDKRLQRSNADGMNLLKNSQDSWNIFFLEETARLVHRKTRNFTTIDQEKKQIEEISSWDSMTTRFVM